MIDTTFELKQIFDINQDTDEACKYSSIHEFRRVKAVITKVGKKSYLVLLAQPHFREGQDKTEH